MHKERSKRVRRMFNNSEGKEMEEDKYSGVQKGEVEMRLEE